jgi:predicted molibdopterin-dependent oxidoreductase YjgC
VNVKGGKVVKLTSNHEISGPNSGSLCAKGRFGYEFIHHPDRLTTPLIKKNGEFKEATWDEALNIVAENFKRIMGEAGPDAIGFFSSARITNEENYVAQKFARAVIGTNNVDHCARL